MERICQHGEEMAETFRERDRTAHRQHILAAPGEDNIGEIGIIFFSYINFFISSFGYLFIEVPEFPALGFLF